LGLAHWLQTVHGVAWFTPMAGAVLAALLSAVIIGWVALHLGQREDTVIGAVWATGMALGVVFIALTPGYAADLMSYLFGNILLVTPRDLGLMAVLAAAVLAVAALFHRQLLAVSFDAEFAELQGVPVARFTYLLLVLTALTVVVLVSVVGIILVIALLTLPAATANLFARRLGPMMAGAVALCALLTAGGLVLSYGPDLPAGAVTILLAGLVWFAAAAVRRRVR
ncbi:MAG TPA: iron chelate uptake ABC transporter family permease subunit, partial [Candidatus Krumholzibacteria bacterium]|nr:iron chelate uptake ABC transporter family permease subunit [Candidatus Krumholzibacteria bacterium]